MLLNFILAWAVFLVVAAALSLKICAKGERLVVLRLGKFMGVRGPGMLLAVPLIDRVFRVDLRKVDRNWENLPEAVLAEKVEKYFFRPGAGPDQNVLP